MKDFAELLGSEVLSEDVKSKLQEAWEQRIQENKQQALSELREEFAQRYEHDKGLIIEAADRMITESIKKELEDFQQDRKALVAERVAYKKGVKEHSELLNKFVMETLAKEVSELRGDRNTQKTNFAKLEEFVLRKLTKELNELREEEQKLVGARVQLVKEGKEIIEQSRQQFLKSAAAKANTVIGEALRNELKQLKEDIKVSRENAFGRKIMEAFAAEFMASGFADGTQVKQLATKIASLEGQINESKVEITKKEQAIAEAQRKQRIAEDTVKRERIMQELMGPLSKDKRSIMEDLLESVQTEKLRESYDKYLPAVLNESGNSHRAKKPLTESTQPSTTSVVTGDKGTIPAEQENKAEIITLKKLAGIEK